MKGGAPRPARSEAGESLVELVVAIAIIGLVVAGLLGGVGTMLWASSDHRSAVELDGLALAAGEAVKAAPYVDCASGTSYALPAPSTDDVTTTLTVSVSDVAYWDGSAFGATCYDQLGTAWKTQRVTVVARSTARDVVTTRTLTVHKHG